MGIVLRQHALERRVVALDGEHGLIDDLADGGLLGVGLEVRPAGFLGHPEDVDSPVLVRVFRVGAALAVGFEPSVLLLKGVGDVLEEDQPEHDVFVLGGVHVRAQRIRRPPEISLESEVGTVALDSVVFWHGSLARPAVSTATSASVY
ncbi:MAG: hypothetical protein KatS3mg015_2958 [Fimbriimonadales bacterium]|nr:MAG: hypothetical protein KatS3mg015_2958 [Fimbriimonadales bacterium]